jgi:hypothetical protein
VQEFPALALPNVNKEEIELDMDDLMPTAVVEKPREDSRERVNRREERRHHRERSDSRDRHRRRGDSRDRYSRRRSSSPRDRRRSRSRENESVKVGLICKGRITKILDFGYFV